MRIVEIASYVRGALRRTEDGMKRTLSARVAAGAAILDRIDPDWFKNFEPANLDIERDDTCALAEVYGTYTKGVEVVFGRGRDAAQRAADAGFFAYAALGRAANLNDPVVVDEYALLTRKWRVEIAERRMREAA